MTSQTRARIYPASGRGCVETGAFRSYTTFHFGPYRAAGKEPFGGLYVLNDDTLGGGQSLAFNIEETTWLFLLPTVGDVRYTDSAGRESVVEVGELQLVCLPAGSSFRVTNPYPAQLINFVQGWLRLPGIAGTQAMVFPFDLNHCQNKLSPLVSFAGAPVQLAIGRFDGRAETVYGMGDPGNGFFVQVLEGAFEVQGRLLESRDGLALWSTPEVELEALSNGALLLVIEFSADNAGRAGE